MDKNEKSTKNELKKDLREKGEGYIAAALGLVAGLAWNDAIKSLIDLFFPEQNAAVLPKFIYAIVITIIVVLISRYLLTPSDKK